MDSDVWIEILRGRPQAVNWLASLGDEEIGLIGFVVLELMLGCRNGTEMAQLRQRLAPYDVYWPSKADLDRSLNTFAQGHLSHGIGVLDAVIGETAAGLGITLDTFNTKHFVPIPGLIASRPY